MSTEYDWRLDAHRCWLLALELARGGHEGLRAWFTGNFSAPARASGRLDRLAASGGGPSPGRAVRSAAKKYSEPQARDFFARTV